MKENNFDIPKSLRPEDTPQSYFTHCKICEAELIENNKHYCIEKVVKRYEGEMGPQVLFEFAICLSCMGDLRRSISTQSQQVMESYMERQIQEQIETHGASALMESFAEGRCTFSQRPTGELEGYQMVAVCQGTKLSRLQPPMIISSAVLENLNEKLSPQTREELDNFEGDNFGGPPELAQLLRDGDIALL